MSRIQGAGAGAASEVSNDEIKKNVEDLVSQERVVIFSKESCPYCYDAKNVSKSQLICLVTFG